MLSTNTFVVLELARQQQEELARKARRGHVVQPRGRRHRWRRRRTADL